MESLKKKAYHYLFRAQFRYLFGVNLGRFNSPKISQISKLKNVIRGAIVMHFFSY